MSHAPRDVRRDLARRHPRSRGAVAIALLLTIVASPAAAEGVVAAGAALTRVSTAPASGFALRAPRADAAVASLESGAAMPASDEVERLPDEQAPFSVTSRSGAFRPLPWQFANRRVESAPGAAWALSIPRAPPSSFCL